MDLDPVKTQIRSATQGNCYFFERPEEEHVHLIVIIQIAGVADLFEQLKAERSGSDIKHGNLRQGDVDTHIEF